MQEFEFFFAKVRKKGVFWERKNEPCKNMSESKGQAVSASLNELKVGKKDKQEEVIVKVLISSPNYVIYETNTGLVRYEAVSNEGITLIPEITEISNLLDTAKERKKFSIQLATIIAECLNGQTEKAQRLAASTKESVYKFKLESRRITYLTFSMAFVAANIVLLVFLMFWSSIIESLAGFKLYWAIATFGSFGGLISILFKVKSIQISEEGKDFYAVLVASRIFFSMIAAIVLYVVMRSNVVFGFINESGNFFIHLALSVAAGFCEKFIPDILQKDHEA